MLTSTATRPIQILLVEDNPADVELTIQALRDAHVHNDLHVASEGRDALAYLHQEGEYEDATKPDLVLLDLNLPGMSGLEILEQIKQDARLRSIPIIILTTSHDLGDIKTAYDRYANCYINKPVDFNEFLDVVRRIESFWFSIVKLPNGQSASAA